jgi:hypothetical protein
MPGEAAPLFSDAPSAPSVTARCAAQRLPLTFNGDGRSTHCEILAQRDKRQLSGVGFDKSEGHAGGF